MRRWMLFVAVCLAQATISCRAHNPVAFAFPIDILKSLTRARMALGCTVELIMKDKDGADRNLLFDRFFAEMNPDLGGTLAILAGPAEFQGGAVFTVRAINASGQVHVMTGSAFGGRAYTGPGNYDSLVVGAIGARSCSLTVAHDEKSGTFECPCEAGCYPKEFPAPASGRFSCTGDFIEVNPTAPPPLPPSDKGEGPGVKASLPDFPQVGFVEASRPGIFKSPPALHQDSEDSPGREAKILKKPASDGRGWLWGQRKRGTGTLDLITRRRNTP